MSGLWAVDQVPDVSSKEAAAAREMMMKRGRREPGSRNNEMEGRELMNATMQTR